jgi:uncharacterized protein
VAKLKKLRKWTLSYLKDNLSIDLTYHSVGHTKEVYNNAVEISMYAGIDKKSTKLIKTAALLHDSGFVTTYSNHEEEGCRLAQRILPDYNYSIKDIDIICGMIMATKIPQNPKNDLEKIIADADLMYLGTDKYAETAETLFHELKAYSMVLKEHEWLKLQISFLEKHEYHTDYCIEKYNKKKQMNLNKLKDLL